MARGAAKDAEVSLIILFPRHFDCRVEIVFLNRVEIALYRGLLKRVVLGVFQDLD